MTEIHSICDWHAVWQLNASKVICRRCKAHQLEVFQDKPFPHLGNCSNRENVYPWVTLSKILENK